MAVEMSKPKIGMVGVGRMGANIARRLADRGYEIAAVYDSHHPVAVSVAGELGAKATESLLDVSVLSDVIFTVVTDDAAMESIFSGVGSLLENAAGKTFINCATVSSESHEKAAEAAAKAGAKTLAASMASSIPQARNGTLYLMIGGEEETYAANEVLLKDISSALRYVGPVGNAAEIKALVNMVMNINTAGLAEGLGLGKALGLDLDVLMEIFSQTGANSRVLQTDGADMVTREHDCFFSASHAAKDSGIANDMAKAAGVHTPLSYATEAQYRKLIELELGELDKSAVAELTFPGRAGSNF
jgi:3-hydroxyisobutyrate dehydrogenase-like beta-hydroxyacid dehydrogenase